MHDMNEDIIDSATLEQLKHMTGSAFSAIIRQYITTSNELMTHIAQSLQTHDLNAASEAAHSLKSSAAQVGALALSNIALQIEEAGGNEDNETCNTLLSKLQSTHTMVIDALEKQAG